MTDNLLAPPNNDNLDTNKDYFSELTGPGGKFYDPDPEVAKQKLATAKLESDRYIATLLRDKDELREDLLKHREELNATAKLSELLDQIKAAQSNNNNTNNPPVDNNKEPAFDLNTIDERIRAYEAETKAKNNFNTVQSKLQEVYGNNYANVLKQKRDALGLTDDDVNTLARRSPEAFFKTFEVDVRAKGDNTFNAPLQNQVRNDNFSPTGGSKRTWSYWQKVRREQPDLYYNPKSVVQRDKDAIELGEAFFDGDFNQI